MEMRAAYAECLAEMMANDRHVVVLDADLAKASGTRKLYERFPGQMFDCGVAEQNMASIAAGLASYGFTPWIESFTPFATRRICDQVAISIAYAGMNVKIVGTDPGISAELNGGTHMSIEDIGVMRSIPGMVIVEPVDEVQLRAAMPAIQAYRGPLYLRLFRKETPAVFKAGYAFDLMKADLLLIDGQYTPVELGGKAGFGHNSWTDAAEFGQLCHARRTLIVHHDPYHKDVDLDRATEDVYYIDPSVNLAYEGEEIEL